MREILFRGKEPQGDWCYGGLIQSANDFYISIGIDKGFMCAFVKPETIGQYTGLTDKNGKKIFEGDIVSYFINIEKATNKEFHEVVFETKGESGYFGIKVSNIGTLGFCPEVSAKLMEVVGNIYDNTELLEA